MPGRILDKSYDFCILLTASPLVNGEIGIGTVTLSKAFILTEGAAGLPLFCAGTEEAIRSSLFYWHDGFLLLVGNGTLYFRHSKK